MLAILLGFTFFIEKRTKTNYQLLSFPVSRGVVIAGKLFSVLSYAFIISFGVALIPAIVPVLHLLQRGILYRPSASLYTQIIFVFDLLWYHFWEVFWISNVNYFIILSMTVAAFGVMHLVKRQRLLIAVGVFILLHGVYELTPVFIHWFTDRLSITNMEIAMYWLIEGIVFTLIGFYLYQKHAEI